MKGKNLKKILDSLNSVLGMLIVLVPLLGRYAQQGTGISHTCCFN